MHGQSQHLKWPFHGGNRGSNPLGDANHFYLNKINKLRGTQSGRMYRENVLRMYWPE
jgi:hypothetical protein